MAQFNPLFLDTGSIEVVAGSRITDYMHFPVTASTISSSYSTNLPDPYLFTTRSANITNAANTTSSSLFEFIVPGRQENYFYAHNSIVGVSTSATTTGVRIGLQRNLTSDGIANIKVSSTLTAHTIACVGSLVGTTFALPASMAAINTIYPSFVKGLYNNSTASVQLNNRILLQPETNNLVTAHSGSVSYNKFIGYQNNLIDRTFNTGTAFNIDVDSIAIQTDGKIVAVGVFTNYNGTSQNRITRINPDGTRDTTFNIGTGFDVQLFNVDIQQDQKIIAVGPFTNYNGTAQSNIIRLNTNGTIDTSFNIGIGFNVTPNTIGIQKDQKIMLSGDFTTYSGSTQNRITRLNTDGTIDTTFNIGTGLNAIANTIYIQNDGKILLGGSFTTYSGSTQNRITRLNTDGTIDTTFNIGTGFDGNVFSITTQTDGKILVGGIFTTYSGSTQNRITRLNIDGTIDTSFNTGNGLSSQPQSVVIQNDGKILAGGSFLLYSGSSSPSIVRINSNGTRDTSFDIGTGFDGTVKNIIIQNDGKILVGGNFTFFNGVSQNRISRLLNNIEVNQKSIPLYLSTGSLTHIVGGHTITSSFLPPTSSLWISQSLATNVANTSATVYANVFTLTGLATGKTYVANLYIIGSSAAAATGFRMRVITGSAYRGTLYTPTSTTAPAIQNSADGNNITSITAGTWPTVNVKYLVYGEYTFVKGATDPQVQILSETAGTAVTAFSGSVIYYRAIE